MVDVGREFLRSQADAADLGGAGEGAGGRTNLVLGGREGGDEPLSYTEGGLMNVGGCGLYVWRLLGEGEIDVKRSMMVSRGSSPLGSQYFMQALCSHKAQPPHTCSGVCGEVGG